MAAPSFVLLKDEYRKLWSSMKTSPDKIGTIDRIAKNLIASKSRYQTVSQKTGVPWAAIAIIHQMECGGSWRLNIAQGDPWDRVSTHVPVGRGPFKSWEDAAVDALKINGTSAVSDWGVERLCYELEKYNGFGSRMKGINTPYLWSYSNHYTRGKYIADHDWDANAVSGQCGAMPLLSRMMALDSSILFAASAAPKPATARTVATSAIVVGAGVAVTRASTVGMVIAFVLIGTAIAVAVHFLWPKNK